MIESQPSAPTKEKRFAYALYLEILSLIIKLADGIERKGGYKPLEDTGFIKRLKADEVLRAYLISNPKSRLLTDAGIYDLEEKIKSSSVYKDFLKKQTEDESLGDRIWEKIYDMIIFPDAQLNRSFSGLENFTLRGVERMNELMKTTFSNYYSARGNDLDALKVLDYSMSKARELYMRMLLLPIDIVDLREQQLNENKGKYLATHEDLNPNTRFIDNEFVKSLRENVELQQYAEKQKINWLAEDRQFVASLLKNIMDSDLYNDYMNFPGTDRKTDCDFWKEVYKNIIFKSEDFLELLETKSVFWNDDVEIMGTFIMKTIKRFEDNVKGNEILPMYKDREDAEFGRQLFSLVLKNKDSYREYVDKSIVKDKWDTERLAFMDVIIIMTALAEILNFPKIPVVVSINEYIEIAKSYSSAKSGSFVNGILASIVLRLRSEGKLVK